MNATVKSKTLPLLVLGGAYLLIPVIARFLAQFFATDVRYGGFWVALLLFVYPAVTLAVAAWSGYRGGNIVVWTFAPAVLFLAPMYIFFNDSALIYGAIYSCISLVACGIGGLFRPASHEGRI